jgi:hypothetical protein
VSEPLAASSPKLNWSCAPAAGQQSARAQSKIELRIGQY